MNATYFVSAAEFRRWLEKNHARTPELLVGFYKKASGKGGLTYPEAVDELLCFGWIDGVKRRVDEDRYTHRITPRKPGSIWSNVNVGHVARLAQAGRMHAAGLKAFAARSAEKTGIYSFEQKKAAVLPPGCLRKFKANRQAWAFFSVQAPWYRRLVTHKIATAKQEATRIRWLTRAITASAAGKRL